MVLDGLIREYFGPDVTLAHLVGGYFRFCSADDEMAGTVTGARNRGKDKEGKDILVLEVSSQKFLQFEVIHIVPTSLGRADLYLAGLPNAQDHFSGDLQIFR